MKFFDYIKNAGLTLAASASNVVTVAGYASFLEALISAGYGYEETHGEALIDTYIIGNTVWGMLDENCVDEKILPSLGL